MYVRRGLERTTPSRMMPIPSLLALPSMPIMVVMVRGEEGEMAPEWVPLAGDCDVLLGIVLNKGVGGNR